MNKLKSILAFLAVILVATACESDRESNPTLQSPTTFVLNEMKYASNGYDLAQTDSLFFKASQPAYGYTAAVKYKLQVTLGDKFVDKTDSTSLNYYEFATVYTTPEAAVTGAELATRVQLLAGWEESTDVPSSFVTVKVRMKAYLVSTSDAIYSNIIDVKVLPYYQNLKSADPAPWFLVGSAIGDGLWNNTTAGVGISMLPMGVVAGTEYDAVTGDGQFRYRGYFPAETGFKIVKTPGSWTYQWGMNGGTYVVNDGGSGNITVPTSGYYIISLNTVSNTLTIEADTETPTVYSAMSIPGSFNGWTVTTAMTAADTTSVYVGHRHNWYYDLTVESAAEAKFAADNAWTKNWGGTDFPIGIANGSANIPISAGKYRVIFNDITASYYFYKLD